MSNTLISNFFYLFNTKLRLALIDIGEKVGKVQTNMGD